MSNNYFLDFISENDFLNHISETVRHYQEILKSIDLKKFNENIIDPIKLTFDQKILNYSFEKMIELEIYRQRDKSNTNAIGYFHQNIFKYIKNCEVPKEGWDIIFKDDKNTYYIEMKNKHNTMNSSSAKNTYLRMQNELLNSDESSICALVEVIAKKSSDKPWVISIDKQKQYVNERLRRISIDKFYAIVTKDRFAFKKLCKQLFISLDKVLETNPQFKVQNDTVLDELKNIDCRLDSALYKLAFKTYEGFEQF